MSDQNTDLLGKPMTDAETKLLAIYRDLEATAARGDLPPCAEANVRQALVMMWNACNDLALIFEEPAHEVGAVNLLHSDQAQVLGHGRVLRCEAVLDAGECPARYRKPSRHEGRL